MSSLKITLVRGYSGRVARQRLVLRALGLHKRHQVVVHQDTPSIRGMLQKVQHLVTVEASR